jgi:ribosomal protein S18 acetylase RimI-like enzyme
MHDMLVKLYDITDDWSFIGKLRENEITLRKPIGPEHQLLIHWVKEKFNAAWASETQNALGNRPISCFLAVKHKKIIGFACYDATALGYFGPTGVEGKYRGNGIGKALLLASLLDMKLKGYGYAIIGGVGPSEYYKKAINAVDIPDSNPGIWKTWVQDLLLSIPMLNL